MTSTIDTTTKTNRLIAAAIVKPEAFAACIRLMLSDEFVRALRTADHLGPTFRIAREHGGDEITARAMHVRLMALDMLLKADPVLKLIIDRLTPEAIGAALASFRLTADGATLDVDGDGLADALRAAMPPEGRA